MAARAARPGAAMPDARRHTTLAWTIRFGAVLLAYALAACTSAPPVPRPLASMPASVLAGVDLRDLPPPIERALAERGLLPPDHAAGEPPDGAGHAWTLTRPSLVTRSEVRAPGGWVSLPLRRSHGTPVVEGAILPPEGVWATGRRMKIDTGGGFVVRLDASASRRLGIAPVREIGRARGLTAFGVSRTGVGLAEAVRVGPVEAGPVLVSIGDGGRHGPMLGVGFVELLGGMLIDWERGRVHLYARGEGPAHVPAGWASTAWRRPEPVVHEGVEGAAPGGVQMVSVREIDVRIGGKAFAGVPDTGFSGAVATGLDLAAGGRSRTGRFSAFGQRRRMRAATLDEPLEIAGVTFEDVLAWRLPPEADPAVGERVIVGAEILSTRPVWFDVERNMMHVWSGEGEPGGAVDRALRAAEPGP